MEVKNSGISNFIQDVIEEDLKLKKVKQLHTRFPPAPNGYLHIGHANVLCINFELANQNKGLYNHKELLKMTFVLFFYSISTIFLGFI